MHTRRSSVVKRPTLVHARPRSAWHLYRPAFVRNGNAVGALVDDGQFHHFHHHATTYVDDRGVDLRAHGLTDPAELQYATLGTADEIGEIERKLIDALMATRECSGDRAKAMQIARIVCSDPGVRC